MTCSMIAAALAVSAISARLKTTLTTGSRRTNPQTMPVPTSAPSTNASRLANTSPKTNGRRGGLEAGEAERVRRATEAHVHDADLRAGEAERDGPPRQARLGVGERPVGEERPA